MAEFPKTYSEANDFPGGKCNTSKLASEIAADATITTGIWGVDRDSDIIKIKFKADPSAAEMTALDGDIAAPAGGLIAAHDNTLGPGSDPKLNADGVQYVAQQVQSIGLEMCDRDILIKTATTDDAATLTVSGADANGDVTYTAQILGLRGNDLTIEHAVGATGAGNENRALAVAVTVGLTTAIAITFGTDGTGASVTPTATAVAAEVNGDATASLHISATAGGTGASNVGTQGATALAGGVTNSVDDVKINPTTFVKAQWKELSLVGCYKDDGGGAYTPCIDQADATTNAILSVWSYCAYSHVTGLPIAIEIRDGLLIVDSATSASLEHQAYAIAAPKIPASFGGSIIQFDAYLKYHAGKTLGATSPAAKALDPFGAGGANGAELRVYLYYPVGTQNNHILRLVTYRPLGTF